MLDDPPNMIDLINYVFCSSQSLCSNHSMWPFVAFYVPEVHGDIPPSLMVLCLFVFSHNNGDQDDLVWSDLA